ncbi:MAG: ribosomal-processing cysteine protease Prp [Clostridia bacterium]|nr:ribosomal-processing cysteine protease Prp [Clostridia bacterium]MBQ8416231.1 ribosomal-processing cysteine protease Prp [Clostridia bacterium]
MIRVMYHAPFELNVYGHAETVGRDEYSAICAAVSALMGGLCEAMEQNRRLLQKKEICLWAGYAHVNVVPKREFGPACKKMFEPCLYGLAHLAKQYPEAIRFVRDGSTKIRRS